MYIDISYLSLAERVLNTGKTKGNTVYLTNMERLSEDFQNNSLPLITCRRVPWRNVIGELLWMISGSTNANELYETYGVPIWKANTTRAALDARNLTHYEEGELGPSYGYMLRGRPFKQFPRRRDQLADCIKSIKENPQSRRHTIALSDPELESQCALPACVDRLMFDVDEEGQLSCNVLQRSADLALGVPHNMAVYALLTHMIAAQTGTTAKQITFAYANVHIYYDHVADMRRLVGYGRRVIEDPCVDHNGKLKVRRILCDPYRSDPPTVTLSPDVERIDDYTLDNVTLNDYTPDDSFKHKMRMIL